MIGVLCHQIDTFIGTKMCVCVCVCVCVCLCVCVFVTVFGLIRSSYSMRPVLPGW
jgi:hypothetical protein